MKSARTRLRTCTTGVLMAWALMACGIKAGTISSAQPTSDTTSCAALWSAETSYRAGERISAGGVNYRAATPSKRAVPLPSRLGHTLVGQGAWVAEGRCQSPNAGNGNSGTSSGMGTGVGGPTLNANFVMGPYKDVTVAADNTSLAMGTAVNGSSQPVLSAAPNLPSVTWAFATGSCGSENWGGLDAKQFAATNVPTFVAAKKPYVVSTGGAGGSFTCTSDADFQTFIERYNSPYLVGIDFDIESGQSDSDVQNIAMRVKMAQQNPNYQHLRFSFTLATLGGQSTQSLGDLGVTTLKALQSAGVQNYLINLMVMDYGSADATNCTLGANKLCAMGQSAIVAAQQLKAGYNVPYAQMELTPMIGGNDNADEIFSLGDVNTMMTFVREQGLAGVHWWSLDRDVDCTGNQKATSSVCAGSNNAGPLGYLKAFVAALL